MEEVEKLKQKIATIGEQQVPTNFIRPNTWNFNVQSGKLFSSLKAALDRFGRIYPVIVREVAKDRYEIIDGEHRWKALRELKIKFTPVKNLGEVSDIIAKELMTVLNKTRGEANPEKLGVSLSRIVRTMEDAGENPLELLPYDEEQLGRLLSVSEVFEPDGVAEEIDEKEWEGMRESTRLCSTHTFASVKMKRCKRCGILEELR